MASPGDVAGSDWLLRGAFGSFQASAQQGLDTAGVWSALRQTVGQWSYQTQGLGGTPSVTELEAAGAKVLQAQGVGAAQVSTYRGIAGQWLSAQQHLANLDPGQQITASEIFQAPWAVTSSGAVASRYRVRVNWEVTPAVGDVFTKWSAYELSTPLTSLQDILGQANASARSIIDSDQIFNAKNLNALDYQVEQI